MTDKIEGGQNPGEHSDDELSIRRNNLRTRLQILRDQEAQAVAIGDDNQKKLINQEMDEILDELES